MVAKISTGSSLYGALAYNQSKVDIEVGKVLSSQKIYGNEQGDIDVRSAMQSFALHIRPDTKTEKPIVHISLNPHPDDKLTDDQLVDIAKEYLEGMGYGEQPYLIYKHDDIERGHVHIVTTNVDHTGRKINDSYEHRRSMKVCRDLEDKYGLHKAERKKQAMAFDFKRVDIRRGDIKSQIASVIKPIAATYRFQSFNEYRTLLAQYNIWVEESKGVRNGNSYAGLIYYAMNDKGIKSSNPFKSSMYGRSVGYVAINEKIERNKEHIKTNKLSRQTASKVRDTLHRSVDRDSFIDKLKVQNIDVVFRENDAGRLYGATFIDHNNRCVFNGSRLGGDLTANAIADWFENPQVVQPDPRQEQGQTHDFQQRQESNANDFSLGGLFDLPIDEGVDDPEEERFRRAMQKKKKRKGRKM
ncbi:MAG: conjugal transfer protein MobB [Rikenellaceae bacterium]